MILYVDIVDVCNLKCPTCVRGTRLLANSPRTMSLDKFERIAIKAQKEGFSTIGFFNWTEPFLAAGLEKYVSIVKTLGLFPVISSNLSLGKIRNLEAVLAETYMLMVSVSGLNQQVYEINHVGGDFDLIMANLEQISLLKRTGRINTRIVLKFIQFDYNVGEREKLRELAERLGLEFEIVTGSGHPSWAMIHAEEDLLQRLSSYNSSRPHEKPGEVCPMLFDHVAIDCEGDIFECCAYGNFDVMRIGQYLDLSPEETLLRRYQHPVCNSCNWPRRAATEEEKYLLARSVLSRLSTQGDTGLPSSATPFHILHNEGIAN